VGEGKAQGDGSADIDDASEGCAAVRDGVESGERGGEIEVDGFEAEAF
jgi:hypothetical protein